MDLPKNARRVGRVKGTSRTGRHPSEERSADRDEITLEFAYRIASAAVVITALDLGTVDWLAVPSDWDSGRLQSDFMRHRPKREAALADTMTVMLSSELAVHWRGTGPSARPRIPLLKPVTFGCGEPREAEAFAKWLSIRTHNVVRRNWNAIESVAHGLVSKGALVGDDVRRLIADAEQRTDPQEADKVPSAPF